MVSPSQLILDGEKAKPKCKKCKGSGFVTVYNPDAFTYTCDCVVDKRTPKMWRSARAAALNINLRYR